MLLENELRMRMSPVKTTHVQLLQWLNGKQQQQQEQVAQHLDGEGAEVRVGETGLTVLTLAPPPLPHRKEEGGERKERQQ